MEWYETTNINNPLSCNGEYRCDVPWLEHSTNEGVAYYSVRKDISGHWEAMFWHGNRGHSVNNFKHCDNEMKAKIDCLEHMKKKCMLNFPLK